MFIGDLTFIKKILEGNDFPSTLSEISRYDFYNKEIPMYASKLVIYKKLLDGCDGDLEKRELYNEKISEVMKWFQKEYKKASPDD